MPQPFSIASHQPPRFKPGPSKSPPTPKHSKFEDDDTSFSLPPLNLHRGYIVVLADPIKPSSDWPKGLPTLSQAHIANQLAMFGRPPVLHADSNPTLGTTAPTHELSSGKDDTDTGTQLMINLRKFRLEQQRLKKIRQEKDPMLE